MRHFRDFTGAFVVSLILVFVSGISFAHEKSVTNVCEKYKPAARPDINKLVLVNTDEVEILPYSGRFIAAKAWRLPGEVPQWVDKGGFVVPGEAEAIFLTTLHIEGEVFLFRWALKLEDGTECAYAAFRDGKTYTERDYPDISPSEGKDYPEILPLPFAVDVRLFISKKNGVSEILGKFPVPKR